MDDDPEVMDAVEEEDVDDADVDDLEELEESVQKDTRALGLIKKGLPDFAKNNSERATTLTLGALSRLEGFPESFKEGTVVLQGPMLVKSSVVAVEVPLPQDGGGGGGGGRIRRQPARRRLPRVAAVAGGLQVRRAMAAGGSHHAGRRGPAHA